MTDVAKVRADYAAAAAGGRWPALNRVASAHGLGVGIVANIIARRGEYSDVGRKKAEKQTVSYSDFLARKLAHAPAVGIEPGPASPHLFPFQADLVSWALRRGRAAVFAATGLGKSRIQLEWARHVVGHAGGRVLILAPLAVTAQTAAEAASIGIDVDVCRDGADLDLASGIVVTNYERLHRFDPGEYVGVVLDESSCIKHADSKGFGILCAAFARAPFRLCATATPAPNDYVELGTHAEFLGICTRAEMLSEYFVHDGGETQAWRLKGHARRAFWRWVSSWGAMVRHPRDLGYDDARYDLPPLETTHHVVAAGLDTARAAGLLFPVEASTMAERRVARRVSVDARVDACASIVNADREQWIVWCDLNAESAALTAAIDGAVEVKGADDSDVKEARLLAFAAGEIRVLVSKPSICGFGMNFQRCSRMAFVGVTDSWEAYYQAVRRCWRFGQTRSVEVHVFASEAEGSVIRNLARKEADASRMADALSAETRDTVRAEVRGAVKETNDYTPTVEMVIPSWVCSGDV